MQSNDARMLLRCALPTAATGVVAAIASGVLAGGKGLLGAIFGAVLVVLFMASGLAVLQYTAKNLPYLFQAMGLMLYVAQLLLLVIFINVFQGTELFHHRAFAVTLIAATLTWVAAQARAHMKAKILYVQPDPAQSGKTGSTGSAP